MHVVFTDEELQWIDTKVFGWRIKNGCPQKTSQTIKKKLKKINDQKIRGEGKNLG